MKYVKYGIEIFIATLVMYITKVFLPKNIWIVSERIDQAQDNGIAFFKYLCTQQEEAFPVYLLAKGSHKAAAVSKIGTVIEEGSLKHKVYFLNAKVIATTEKNIIEPWGGNIFYSKLAWLYPKKVKVFLQHGILDKDVSAVYGKAVSNFDLFITSTEEEKQFVLYKFGYDTSEVKVTGLARYDYLWQQKDIVKKENIILYAPTWRRYLRDLANTDTAYIEACKRDFKQSLYFKSVQAVLESEELQQMLEEKDYKLVFITHHGMNDFEELFVARSSRVQIFKSEEISIAHWLLKAKIFMTDYSSIHFDSAYIGNRNIYYQFDKSEFEAHHAGKSYFDYSRDGFGQVVSNLQELLEVIKSEVAEEGLEKEMYSNRRERFFKYSDSMNCKRIYGEVKSRLNEDSTD